MADKGSSSKSKSSKRKRDKTSSKKKSRRKESKKPRRIHDSASSYSDHDSLISEHSLSSIDGRRRINKSKKRRRDYSDDSSDSDSLSAHDSGVKRRKVRESRVSSKSTKKRSRKRSLSPKGDARVVRKRKRLDKDRIAVKSIKKSSKKKLKKYVSCSSSSDSESSSTPQSRSSADGKSRRIKIVLDKERGRESYKAHKKSKVRSPSISSGGHSDRATSPVVNNTRRLRSVIAVVVQPNDEGENRWETDPQKEEIFYDKNDYHPPKSVDSNERVSKKIHEENVAGEETTELTKSRIDESDRSIHHSEGTRVNNLEKEKESYVSAPVAALGGDILESILRQKALENLKKFKGKLQTGPRNTDPKINSETDVNESTNQSRSNTRETNQINGSTLKGDTCIEEEPGIAEQTVVAATLECSKEDKCSSSHAILDEPLLTNDDKRDAADPSLSSSDRLMSEEHSLEQNDEAKDGSQFKKKTMSVMRGGEVVQVSYKVYIPKKTPALARRQFKR